MEFLKELGISDTAVSQGDCGIGRTETMKNYEIIKNNAELVDFIETLPDLDIGDKFYLCLFARKKYGAPISSDKGQLKRFLATKFNIFEKIQQLVISRATSGLRIV